MRRTLMRRPFVVAVVAALGIGALGFGVSSVAAAATPPPTKTVTITSVKCAGAQSYCFKVAALTVKPNTKVVWKNTTFAPHDVTRCTIKTCPVNGGTGKDVNFKSKQIDPGKAFAFTFHKKGTYRYWCTIHGYPAMHGTITVK